MSKKHKELSTTLNYIEHILILGYTITGCVSISDFACLVDPWKSNKSIHFLHTNFMVKKFNDIFYNIQPFIWVCRAN